MNISWQPCTGTASRLVENDRQWNSSIKMISRDTIKKQVIGEDADLENIGRMLDGVIKWCRDGMTIEGAIEAS